MPIVVFARTRDALSDPAASAHQRTMIEVSDPVARRLEFKLGGREGTLFARHLPKLQELASAREYDADLQLLIRALDEDAQLYVRLL